VGDVYLVDFGSVQTAASKEEGTITIVGSYGYMPLEQFGGQTTAASDLYSLGMTIIYLLTGAHPAELPQVNGQVKFTAEISNKFYRWIEKAIRPHLVKRFDTAKSAQNSLTSGDISYGDFLHIKPAHSQVDLYRDRNKLEIRFSFLDDLSWLWTVVVAYLILAGFFYAVSLIEPGVLLVILLAWVFGFLIAVYVTDACQFTKTRVVSIEREPKRLRKGNVLKRNNIIKWDELELSKLDILVYSPGYIFNKYINSDGELNRGEVVIAPELYFRGYGKALINETEANFSEAELCWLGQEISDFLDIELQVIYATPKLPEVSDDL
jgi:serine/threonine protein kinase